MHRKFCQSAALSAVSAIALCTGGASAQSQAISSGIETITVTAEKRESSIQDVPISILAYSGDRLQALAVDDIMSLYQSTPSLGFSRAGGEAQIYIRGVGTSAFGVTVDPSVAIHQDGVYLSRPNMGLTQFLDVDRVEILRGPQGTLYGRNATGGAINIISKMPTDDWSGDFGATYGNFDRIEVRGAVGGPLSDTFGVRIAARYLDDSGYTIDQDLNGSNDIDDQQIAAFRAIAQWRPNDRVDVRFISEYSDFSSNNRSIQPLDNLGLAETQGAQPQEFGETRNDLDTYFDWEFFGFTALADIQFGDVTLSSITSYKDYKSDFLFNTDGTEIDVTRTNFQIDTDQISQELRLAGTIGDRFEWLLGGFFLHEDKFGALGLARAPLGLSFFIPNEGTTDALAVFTNVRYQVSDTVTLLGGLRYSYEKKEDITFVGAVGDLLALESPLEPNFFGDPRDDEESWDDVSPRIGVEFQPRDELLFFASISKGFKSGGWNAFDRSPAFEPETVWSYEIGAKTDWLDRRLRVNATAFYYDYSDLQVSTFLDGVTVTTNAAEATVKGFEFEITAQPVDALTLNLNGSYLDAQYDDFINPFGRCPVDATPAEISQCAGAEPGAQRILNISGNQLVNAPEFKVTANAEYRKMVTDDLLMTLFGQISHQSQTFYTQQNEDIVGQDGFTLVDARVSIGDRDGGWEVGAYVRNLFDKDYYQNVVRFTSTSDPANDRFSIGNALGYPAPGRTYGIQASYGF